MSKPVCRFYSYNKNCRFGKNCRYLHTESQRPPPLQNPRHENEESSVKNQLSALSLDKEIKGIDSSVKNEEPVSGKLHTSDPLKVDSLSAAPRETQNEEFASVEPPPSQSNQKGRKICQFFYRNGYCCFGRNCRFFHAAQIKSGSALDSSDVGSEPAGSQRRFQRHVPPRFQRGSGQKTQYNTKDNVDEDIKPSKKGIHQSPGQRSQKGRPQNQDGSSDKQDRRRICPFFKSGRCNRGERCRFVHISSDLNEGFEVEKLAREETQDTKDTAVRADPRSKVQPRVVHRPGAKTTITFDEVETDGTSKLRDTEIEIIKKRFPRDRIEVLEHTENFVAKVVFIPSDPDWPYDVKAFELILTVPPEYPKKTFSVSLPGDQDTPETVRRYVEVSIEEWLTERYSKMQAERRVELTFRPFLHWLDRAIEQITTDALQQLKRELVARAAGMTFIPAHKLQAKLRTQTESSTEADGDNKDEEESEEDHTQSSDTSGSSEDIDDDDDDDEDDEDEASKPSLSLDPEKKGTEIGLRNLQLKENAATLLFDKLMLIIQCERCKNHAELRVPQKRVMSLSCEKCRHNQYIHFRPALIHQFSSVVGYLDVDGCKAFDLIFQECQAQVGCMGCNKQTRVNGFVSGQMIDGWCQACNARFKFATDAVKFSQLVPSGVETSNKVIEVTPAKSKKPPKDPAIREGHPLPEFGTCKHYKHSYRWLRFPCCGKAYPCDICHDKKEDHEMVLANRMICGHCCREQNYAGMRPCTACKQNLTKVHSSHWEGGSGCRDKVRMSKTDQQKYKNMNKTVSNHQKKVQAGSSKKKTTKLRHA